MKIIRKLKAIFSKERQTVVLDLEAAEVKAGGAYLHPKGNKGLTYLVRSNDIEIHLSRNKELSDGDIVILKRKEDLPTDKKVNGNIERKSGISTSGPATSGEMYDRFKKRTFSVSLYQHEYDTLMKAINDYGYKRAEFILASANTATRSTMERERKKIVRDHKEIRKEERIARATRQTD